MGLPGDCELAEAFVRESKHRVAFCRDILNHSLEQLEDEDVWWSPGEDCNSVGVIVQHLLGNLGQWVLSGIGRALDTRDRPSEFRVGNKTPKAILQARLNKMLDQVEGTYAAITAADLLETRVIQGYTLSGLSAMLRYDGSPGVTRRTDPLPDQAQAGRDLPIASSTQGGDRLLTDSERSSEKNGWVPRQLIAR